MAEELQAAGTVRRTGHSARSWPNSPPKGEHRMGANPHANGGDSPARPAHAGFPRIRRARSRPRCSRRRGHAHPRQFLRDVIKLNQDQRKLPRLRPRRNRSPTASTPSSKPPIASGSRQTIPIDEFLAPDGRVMEVLSEHQCEGWLEGYLLTGRHGLFNCYEAFIHIVDSMFNQHAKWLKVTRRLPWRAKNRLAELPSGIARLAAGPQRLHATRTPASSITSSTKKRRSSASICPPTPTASSR